MQKLALNADDLALQSFGTTPIANATPGTVGAYLDDTAYEACATQVYTCAGCAPDEPPAGDGDPDAQRRIIVYSTTS